MNTFKLRIITPDGVFFDDEATKIVVRTIVGDVCILPRHTNYLTALGIGTCRVDFNQETKKAACIGGMIAVNENQVTISAATFEWSDQIDVERAIRSKERAEKTLAKQLGHQEHQLAEARLKRALARLNTTSYYN